MNIGTTQSTGPLYALSYVLSVSILGMIGAGIWAGKVSADNPISMLVIGSLLTMLGQIVGYWFGSSATQRQQTRATDQPTQPGTQSLTTTQQNVETIVERMKL